MVKRSQKMSEQEVVVDEEAVVVADETVEKPVKKRGGRNIVVTLADGTEMTRTEYCIKRAHEGAKRSEIANELSVLQGVTVPFQIVFAATAHLHDIYPKRQPKAVETVEVAAE